MSTAGKQHVPLDGFLLQHAVATWDLLLMGDGSGLQWELGGGYAVFLIDKTSGRRAHLVGARTLTTINRMELSAYIEALAFHYSQFMRHAIEAPPYRVHVFSDSKLTVDCGAGRCMRKANGDLWQSIDWFETRGYRITWHHMPRNNSQFHVLADELAGKARLAVNDLRVSDAQLYELMPATPVEQVSETVTCAECSTPYAAIEGACPICGTTRPR